MSGILAQLFVALGVSLTAGMILGFTAGAKRGDDHHAGRSSPPPAPPADLEEVVAREAELIEALARADADLRAHATELADANEEIVSLLDQLHEARRGRVDDSAPT